MLTIAECPCPGDFISAGVRLTFSKRSISGTELTTATSRFGDMTEACTSSRVAVIAALGSAVFAAKAATTTIPIVFISAEDPVRLGLVASLARPGGNLTGFNIFNEELAAKRLELLRELVPGATRVAVLVDPTNAPASESTLRDVEAAARALGLQIQVLEASNSREINAAFATFVRERP